MRSTLAILFALLLAGASAQAYQAQHEGPEEPLRRVRLIADDAPALAEIFYEADRRTYGPRWVGVEFVAARCSEPPTEYRIAIDNREYQRTLSRLQYLASTAARHGNGVRIRI